MGIAPAPPWATFYYSLHERNFIPHWDKYLLFYKRFFDDIFGICLPYSHPDIDALFWSQFTHNLQLWIGLEWTVTPGHKHVISWTCN